MANLLFFCCLLFALCNQSLSAHVFISIDCGSSATYKDENGIIWTGDDEYVKTGKSRYVPSSNSIDHVTDTLRVFTNGMMAKNCYNINSVRPGRVLLRATFYYGNYDGKSSPPSFRFMFDGNDWGTVQNSGPTPTSYELIYVTSKDSISVCVAQINEGEFPFISALEVRSLESDMYRDLDVGYPFSTRRRVAYGTNATIRFADDPYDRRWLPDAYANETIKVSNDDAPPRFSSGAMTSNKPPPAVILNAVTSTNLNSSIPLSMALSSYSRNFSAYIYMYFCEVDSRLKPNQTRSMYIYKDDRRISPLILLSYGKCTEIGGSATISSNTSFSVVAAQNSTLPPLINAMEVLLMGDDQLSNSTHQNDVEGLASLQEAFSSLQNWSGDPCLPTDYNWDWLKCNDDSTPRVTTLLLGNHGLSGLLPDLSSMDALHTINLSNNSLQGNIPDFLGTLPNLQILNLENNQFNGTIPISLSTKKNLILRVSGNTALCASNTSCLQIPAGGPSPSANSAVRMIRKRKNILEMMFAIIVPFIIILH